MSDSGTLGYLNQQVVALKKEVAALRGQLRDIDSNVLDEAHHRELLAAATINKASELVDSMDRYVRQTQLPNTNRDHVLINRAAKTKRSRERRAAYEKRKEMEALTRKLTKQPCTCGKHYGLSFYDGRKKIHSNVCPLYWWKTMSLIASYEGWLGKFLKEQPWEETNEKTLMETK